LALNKAPARRIFLPDKRQRTGKENIMPNITLEGPRITDIAKKRELVKTVTDAAVQAYGLPKQTMIVVLKDNPPENVAIGGELLSDRAAGK